MDCPPQAEIVSPPIGVVHLCCIEQSATGGRAGNVNRIKTNGKRGSAVVLLFQVVLTRESLV